jgi:autotransporter-associated beta strand protein
MTGTLADTVDVTVASGATYDVDATDTIQSLAGAGDVQIATGVILTFGDANAKTLSGDISGAGSIVKEGNGTQTLSGTNTYTGDTTINAGTLNVSSTGTLADTTDVTVASGATYDVDATDTIQSLAGAGDVQIATGVILTFGDANAKTLSGDISGAGSIVKEGNGTQTLSGTNTYTGDTTINAGTIKLTGNLNSATDLVIASGATLRFTSGTDCSDPGLRWHHQ